jgi:hypothetical protein
MSGNQIGIGKRLTGGALNLEVVDDLPNLSMSLIPRAGDCAMSVVRLRF